MTALSGDYSEAGGYNTSDSISAQHFNLELILGTNSIELFTGSSGVPII
jgi:hypothetical protein